jgi:uncharacterized membrane protein
VRNFLLWLHIAIAIVAFGPTFTFPIWTAMARKAGGPVVPYAVGTVKLVFERVIVPLAVVMPFTGVLLIYQSSWDLWREGWLVAGIVLYTIMFTIGVGLGLPNVRRMLALMAAGPGPNEMTEIQARANRQKLFGYTNNVLVLAIVYLMVAKPG